MEPLGTCTYSQRLTLLSKAVSQGCLSPWSLKQVQVWFPGLCLCLVFTFQGRWGLNSSFSLREHWTLPAELYRVTKWDSSPLLTHGQRNHCLTKASHWIWGFWGLWWAPLEGGCMAVLPFPPCSVFFLALSSDSVITSMNFHSSPPFGLWNKLFFPTWTLLTQVTKSPLPVHYLTRNCPRTFFGAPVAWQNEKIQTIGIQIWCFQFVSFWIPSNFSWFICGHVILCTNL